jgi:hypothetical protein
VQGFFIIVYFMGGLRYNAGAFFGSYGTMLLTMLVAQVGVGGGCAGVCVRWAMGVWGGGQRALCAAMQQPSHKLCRG